MTNKNRKGYKEVRSDYVMEFPKIFTNPSIDDTIDEIKRTDGYNGFVSVIINIFKRLFKK